jgi:hypothetical protein
MVDVVDDELPLGILGALAHRFGVRRDLEGVFDYRRKIIASWFPSYDGVANHHHHAAS